ncbi:MAG: ATP-binding protein [Flavobacteriales bacterium]|nr:ATP-binding protein [Flavobacteriales bacterium]
MSEKKIDPFRHEYFLGYINQVFPQFVRVHFPSSVLLNGFTHFGKEFNGGLVGSFVVIEGERNGYLGRITELSLPESERLSLNEKAFQTSDFHPTGKIEILLSFDLYSPLSVKKGLTSYPHIGAKVFVSSGELVQEYMSRFGVREGETKSTSKLGTLVASPDTSVDVNLQSIFGRHCAVVGTTGGGKSYTVSKLVEALITTGNKSIIIDATGEYSGLSKLPSTVDCNLGIDSYFHYSRLTVADLFALFRPSGQVQQPILLEAINSLKLAALLNEKKADYTVTEVDDVVTYSFAAKGGVVVSVQVANGCIVKAGHKTMPFNRLCAIYTKELNDFTIVGFDITKLPAQISNECYSIFGDSWSNRQDDRNLGNASSLILRIHQSLSEPSFRKALGFDNAKMIDVGNSLSEFIESTNTNSLLRIGFNGVPSSLQVKEMVANAIGTFLLNKARDGFFDSKNKKGAKPLVLFIDEAHQFLNKQVKDEYFNSVNLDAYDSIAKECRKHGLFLCIATQMPRDIPHGTLSQMGTFIVHRLINHNDKEAITNACSSANKNTLDFLPVLGEGEAILTGVDFPMPIIMKFDLPNNPPNSDTPSLN